MAGCLTRIESRPNGSRIADPCRNTDAIILTHDWKYEPDLAHCSEVDVRFVPLSPDATRVEVEHRHFERHGDGAATIRAAVDAPNGWTLVTSLYVDRVAQSSKPKA